MPQTLRDQQRRESHLYQQAGVGVPDVVDTNLFHTGMLAATLHLVGQVMLRVGEQPGVGLQAVALCDIVLEAILQALRNRDDTVALGSLRRGDDVLAADPLVALVDRDRGLLEVDVRRRQRQQFAFPHAGVVQRHEDGVGRGLVFDRLDECAELVFSPEQHLVGLLLAHAACLVAGILLQPVVFYRVVEDGDQLVVDDLEIGGRIGLAFFVPVTSQAVLPSSHVCGLDLVQGHFPEEGRDLEVDHPVFAGHGGGLEPLLHILHVDLDEVLETHPQAAVGLINEVPFPLLGFALGVEASFLFVDDLSRPILDADLNHPLVGLFILAY